MATGLSFGFNFPVGQFPICHHHQRVLPTLMTPQAPRPLRHSIDAILDKPSPSTSPTSDVSSPPSPAAQLPPFDVLARRVSAETQITSAQSEREIDVMDANSASSAASLRAVAPGSDVDDDEEADDFIVVDEGDDYITQNVRTENEDAHTSEAENCSPKLSSQKASSPKDSDFQTSTSKIKMTTNEDSAKVRSAFRPIVRPWLLGGSTDNVSDSNSNTNMTKTAHSLVSAKGVADDSAPEKTSFPKQASHDFVRGMTPLDAISMLRRQSSAFRVCGNRLNSGQGQMQINTPGTRVMIPSCVGMGAGLPGVGQPLPGNLATWFSWLRSGHSMNAQPTPHHPAQAAQRNVLAPSNVLPQPPPQHQAPRYNCEACGKSYSTFGGLSKHKQFHCAAQIKKDFRCKYCDKSYSSLGALKMHIRTHTLPCKCSMCGKAFSRPWLLQGHVRTHTGEKPFSCPHCQRAFADRSNLRAHLQTHSDVKKYSCRACSKTFSRMSLLVKHRESSCVALQR